MDLVKDETPGPAWLHQTVMVRKLCGKSSFQEEKIRYNLVGGTGWLVNHQIVSPLHRLIPLYEEQEQDIIT